MEVIKKIEGLEISLKSWVISFVSILFVRFLLESISSPAPSRMMPTDPYTLVQYGLFFLCIALGLSCIIGFLTKKYFEAGKFVLIIFPIIWIAPILDILFSGGQTMSYIYDLPKDLFLDFFKFLTLQPVRGITTGMQVQFITLFLVIGYYIFVKTKKIKSVIFGLLLSYIFLFIIGSIPSLVYTLTNLQSLGENRVEITNYLNKLIIYSNIFHNTLHETAFSVSPFRFFQLGFDKLMSQILFIFSVLLSMFFFYGATPGKFMLVVKNSRPERIVYYLSPLLMAMGFAYYEGYGVYRHVDLLAIVCLLLSWYGMWIYSVMINDIYDVEIDKISNTNRPLVQTTLTVSEVESIALIHILMALLGSWSAGFYSFFLVLVGLLVAYLYSAPPLRLRSLPIISSFLISLVILSATLSGFYFVSFDKTIDTFPTLLIVGIIIFYTLQINFKDIKDVAGDSRNEVGTIPSKWGNKTTAVLFAMSYILIPIFLNFYFLYIITIPFSIIGYKLVSSKIYREGKIFILQFLFLLIISLVYVGLRSLVV
ncbi:MAG: UbiA family prenyltransferase [Minisyncoccia bacterium]